MRLYIIIRINGFIYNSGCKKRYGFYFIYRIDFLQRGDSIADPSNRK